MVEPSKWIKDIKPEDLPRQYEEMVMLIGVEATMTLADYYKKQPFYFVGLEKIIEKKKKEHIIVSFTGNNRDFSIKKVSVKDNHSFLKSSKSTTFKKQQLPIRNIFCIFLQRFVSQVCYKKNRRLFLT